MASSLPPSLRKVRARDGAPSSQTVGGGMKEFVNGMMSPFTACWQPEIGACVPGCGPEFRARKFTASKTHASSSTVVSPLIDRMNLPKYDIPVSPVTSYRSSRGAPLDNEEGQESVLSADIEHPHANDVLCGRGGSSNRHLGNMNFRELVAANKKTYVCLTKKQKMLVARSIVEMVHSTEPPGRFLAKDQDTGLWYDIGLPRSLEKTSQALREKNSNEYPPEEGTEVSDVLSDTSLLYSPRSDSGGSSPTGVEEDKPSSSKSGISKHVEAPSLTIPPHLTKVFGTKYAVDSQHAWPEYSSSGRHLEQPHLHSYPPTAAPVSPPREHYAVHPRPYPYDAQSPRSPHHYHGTPPPRYNYGAEHGAHYHPYHAYGHPESPQDYREHYDYYSRHSDPREYYGHPSPRRAPPPPPPPPHRALYLAYPPPPPPPGQPPGQFRQHRHPPPPSALFHRSLSLRAAHGGQHGPPCAPPPHAIVHPSTPPSPSSMGGLRSPSSGYVRCKSEVSPERRQEWKRQRNERGVSRRLNSETCLSIAVVNALSLDERVVGQERGQPASSMLTPIPSAPTSSSRPQQLTSPSGALQGRCRPRAMEIRSASVDAASLTEKEGDAVSVLSGLAALSKAAFLKLDDAK